MLRKLAFASSPLVVLQMLAHSCASAQPSPTATEAITETYSVRDIVVDPAAGEGARLDLLADNLRAATGSEHWADGSIRIEEGGVLAITATPETHRLVEAVLGDLRRFARSRH